MSSLLAFGVVQKSKKDGHAIDSGKSTPKKKKGTGKKPVENTLVSKIRAKEASPVPSTKKKNSSFTGQRKKKIPEDFDDTISSYASFEPLEEEKYIPLASNEEFVSDAFHTIDDEPYEEEECKEDGDDDESNITYDFSDTVSESSDTTNDSETNSMMIDKKYTSAWKHRERKHQVKKFTGPQLTIDFDSDSD